MSNLVELVELLLAIRNDIAEDIDDLRDDMASLRDDVSNLKRNVDAAANQMANQIDRWNKFISSKK